MTVLLIAAAVAFAAGAITLLIIYTIHDVQENSFPHSGDARNLWERVEPLSITRQGHIVYPDSSDPGF